MATRRLFLSGLLAAGLAPVPSWADAGGPDYLAAGWAGEGDYLLCGLTAGGQVTFRVALPGRGHAAAAHPFRPEAVAFARRPGTFAIVLDCRTGAILAKLESPSERHFYGHGAFSADGTILYTTENAYEEGQGRIGIWDAAHGYRRLGEVDSGGVGPHEILRLPGTDTLVVANGGIDTHPDSGRAKLNLPFMEPSLAYLDGDGAILEQHRLTGADHLNSLRHLAVTADGQVAAALQWQGDAASAPPLLILHRQGAELRPVACAPEEHRRMDGYAGSVAFSGDGHSVAISSPRGGRVQSFDVATGAPQGAIDLVDACGLASAPNGIAVTTGTGVLGCLDSSGAFYKSGLEPLAWDNHLVPVGASVT